MTPVAPATRTRIVVSCLGSTQRGRAAPAGCDRLRGRTSCESSQIDRLTRPVYEREGGRMPEDTAELYSTLRPLLFSIAYRMLGTVTEAEDVVQESFLRFHRAVGEGTQVETPKAYLTTTATRLSLDVLRSARRQRVERQAGRRRRQVGLGGLDLG